MAFTSGTAYPESDIEADDEYERSVIDGGRSPTSSEDISSSEHTPTTYGAHDSGDKLLPEGTITDWTAEDCAEFVGSLGLRQYADQFLGINWRPQRNIGEEADLEQRMRLSVKHW